MTAGARVTPGLTDIAAALSLAAWLYLLLFHGRFWRADQRLPRDLPAPPAWPDVVAVIPARNEADVVGRAVRSVLGQRYRGRLRVVVVDDRSDDGTAAAARRGAAASGHPPGRFEVVAGRPLPPGWAGKVWAMHQGVSHAERTMPAASYVWLTDADVEHDPDELARLVAMARGGQYDLVSLMVRLHCRQGWERLLIPAFVFFFQKLYPFPRVNRARSRVAGAAGGCMLLRRRALRRIGGLEAIRGAVIDDCALARAVKPGGRVWLGLTAATRSLRPYDGLGGIWDMVARSAYTQLRHQPLLLLATVAGMVLVYLVPPAALAAGSGWTAAAGGLACLIMASVYLPTLRLYGLPACFGLSLPLAGLLYALMTVDSARRHYAGRRDQWKGRRYAPQAG